MLGPALNQNSHRDSPQSLVTRVHSISSIPLNTQLRKVRVLKRMLNLLSHKPLLRIDIQAIHVKRRFSLIPTNRHHNGFSARWRRTSQRSGNSHPVLLARILDLDAADVGEDVGVDVLRALDLVQELSPDVELVHEAGVGRVLGDNGGSIVCDFSDGKAEIYEAFEMGPDACEVCAGDVGAALDQVYR